MALDTALRIETVGDTRDRLGECPLWDERRQALYWIDSHAHVVRRLAAAGGAPREWALPQQVGSIALWDDGGDATGEGSLLVALADGFHRLDLASGDLTPVAAVTHPAPSMRLNDGRTDRAGRFLCGSMTLGRVEPAGVLYQLNGDGAVRELARGFATSNTTSFSPDGRWLYFSDSHARQVWRWPYDSARGEIAGPREDFIDIRPLQSAPDGACVDADGGLWIALVLTGELARFDERGRLALKVRTAVPYVSCPCIGGPALDTVFLTTIRDTGNLLRTDHPDGGALLAVHGTGVRGLPEVRFNGGIPKDHP